MYSVRRRLTVTLAFGITTLIASAGVFIEKRFKQSVTQEFDFALIAKARAFVSLTESENGVIELDYAPTYMPEFERDEGPEYFQFWLDDGTTLYRSTHLEKQDAEFPLAAGTLIDPVIRDIDLPDGRSGRMVQIAYVPLEARVENPPGEAVETRGVAIAVARGREHLDRRLAETMWLIGGIGGMAIGLSVLLVWRALLRGFRPIHELASRVRSLDAEGLESRIDVPRTPIELAPVTEQLNALLARLEDAFQRERRFAGNVAHELRTPIAELRNLATVGGKWPDDTESVMHYFEDVGDIADRMETVISDLLLLARCQAGVERTTQSQIDVRSALAASWSALVQTTPSTGTRFRLEADDGLSIVSDRGKLDIVFANLLGNAQAYASPGTEIVCRATRAGNRFRIEIANAAKTMAAEELARVTEPFWRRDEARSSSEHAGLGLSLVNAISNLLGFELEVDQDASGVFRISIAGDATMRDTTFTSTRHRSPPARGTRSG